MKWWIFEKVDNGFPVWLSSGERGGEGEKAIEIVMGIILKDLCFASSCNKGWAAVGRGLIAKFQFHFQKSPYSLQLLWQPRPPQGYLIHLTLLPWQRLLTHRLLRPRRKYWSMLYWALQYSDLLGFPPGIGSWLRLPIVFARPPPRQANVRGWVESWGWAESSVLNLWNWRVAAGPVRWAVWFQVLSIHQNRCAHRLVMAWSLLMACTPAGERPGRWPREKCAP